MSHWQSRNMIIKKNKNRCQLYCAVFCCSSFLARHKCCPAGTSSQQVTLVRVWGAVCLCSALLNPCVLKSSAKPQTYKYACMHVWVLPAHTQTHVDMHAHTQTYTCTHAHTHMYMHTCTHTHTTPTPTHIHTHVHHTHTLHIKDSSMGIWSPCPNSDLSQPCCFVSFKTENGFWIQTNLKIWRLVISES